MLLESVDHTSCFIPLVGNPAEVMKCFKPKLLSAAIQDALNVSPDLVFTVSINSFVYTDTASDHSYIHSLLQVLHLLPFLVFILAWPFIPFAGNGLTAAGVSR